MRGLSNGVGSCGLSYIIRASAGGPTNYPRPFGSPPFLTRLVSRYCSVKKILSLTLSGIKPKPVVPVSKAGSKKSNIGSKTLSLIVAIS